MNDEQTLSERAFADALMREGQYAKGILLYRQLTERFPEEDSHLLALAWALHDAGMRKEAADCFERLFHKEIAGKVFAGFAFDELVRMYREEERWDALVSVCERAVAAQPEDAGPLRTLGEAYLAGNRPDDALGVFEALTSREPDAAENWCALGDAQIARGNPVRAEEAYERAAEREPADAPVFFSRLAERLLRAGYLPHAQAAIERAIALCPRAPLYLAALGDILVHRGKPTDAVETYARAVALNPAEAGVFWFRLGNLFQKEGLHSSGGEAFRRAVAAEPGNPRYLLNLAACYAAQGLVDLAGTTLRKAQETSAVAKRGEPRG